MRIKKILALLISAALALALLVGCGGYTPIPSSVY